ncbi:hypothetical protein QYF36_010539 [Acer negundo]|nr:hypothetical protein QYF36_010539 [Acer negundo]
MSYRHIVYRLGAGGSDVIASPFLLSSNDPQADLVDPALKGTLNVLRSCAKVPSIRRVIVTSSMAAVSFNGKPLSPEVTVDETWFSDPAFCEKSKLSYMLGKTLAEEAAWKFSEENRIDMVAINPGMVIGPLLQSQSTLDSSSSVMPVLNLVKGVKIPCKTYRWVDVRDVANAHIQAFENPSACGRYCLAERVANSFGIFKILHELYPDLNLPEEYTEEKASEPNYQVSKERAQSLGITYIPLEVSLKLLNIEYVMLAKSHFKIVDQNINFSYVFRSTSRGFRSNRSDLEDGLPFYFSLGWRRSMLIDPEVGSGQILVTKWYSAM